LRHNKLNPT